MNARHDTHQQIVGRNGLYTKTVQSQQVDTGTGLEAGKEQRLRTLFTLIQYNQMNGITM